MTIPTIVHHESFAVILYQWTNNNGEIEITILTIVHHVSHFHCYFIPTEEQQRLDLNEQSNNCSPCDRGDFVGICVGNGYIVKKEQFFCNVI